VEYQVGTLPIVISVPHGGFRIPTLIPDRTCNDPVTVTDAYTIETAEKILAEPHPRNQKKLGREVKNFNKLTWDDMCYDLVKDGLREKFNQNPDLKEYLLKYKGYTIVEASPEDAIWGIGFGEWEALDQIDNWGKNYLGKICTELANEL
jgi:hypothetical protein